MTVAFPDTVAFTGYDAPVRIEGDVHDPEVIGTLPPELEGSWYRCGPEPQYPPFSGDEIFINGDGMVTIFRSDRGHVDFKSRCVRTERWQAARAARRSLYGEYRTPFTDTPDVRGRSRGTANTTPVWHGGRLLALKKDHIPMQLDPVTLATIGPFDWNDAWHSETVTAHPKIDLRTGEWLLFGYGGPPQIFHGDHDTAYQEGHFITRGEAEDDGWYVNIADRHDHKCCDLLVFDARHIDRGPVAMARLSPRLRNAFHTTWVPA